MPLVVLLCLLSLLHGACAVFTEQLTLRPLPAINQVLGHFEFVMDEASFPNSASLFPNVLRQIIEKHDAESLHLTFAIGRYADWRYGSAQSFNSSGFAHAPFGTRLQVVLRGDNETQQRWRGITSELGGLFSASLNQMDETVVTGVLPASTPLELGAFPSTETNPALVFLHGSLAREELCTENLTPWLKMLPCRAFAGLGALIDPINAVSGEYLSLSLFAERSSNGKWRLRQHLTTVQGPSKHNRLRWSLGSLFFASDQANEDIAACPLAEKSFIHTEGMQSLNVMTTNLRDQHVSLSNPWFQEWKLAAEEAISKSIYKAQQDVVSVHRFVTGYGQVRGGIVVHLKNNHPSCGMHVRYHDVIPWYLRVYFHTFRATASGSKMNAQELIEVFDFVPAELRGRPNQLRLKAFLPANTTLVFSLQMEKAFLRLSEHPPDANRGFDIASGVATFDVVVDANAASICEKEAGSPTFTTTLFTEPLLVPLPTPDFSMPYNVITMTSTVVAFFVGTMLNALLRKAPRLKQMMTNTVK
ncbi:GPI transamidase component [Phytophthora palmivora]|uniref:GPI transamidase component n=1 Tax=Phytophthora palmivora TaxID=4796 RepID=A0A2P4X2A9_9STRA|nr:GPI transamidase component [Phytophthora palmivora]